MKFGLDEVSFIASLTAQPEFTSAAAVLATGLPASLLVDLGSNPISAVVDFVAAAGSPTWLSAVPTQVLPYLSSVLAKETAIFAASGETTDQVSYAHPSSYSIH